MTPPSSAPAMPAIAPSITKAMAAAIRAATRGDGRTSSFAAARAGRGSSDCSRKRPPTATASRAPWRSRTARLPRAPRARRMSSSARPAAGDRRRRWSLRRRRRRRDQHRRRERIRRVRRRLRVHVGDIRGLRWRRRRRRGRRPDDFTQAPAAARLPARVADVTRWLAVSLRSQGPPQSTSLSPLSRRPSVHHGPAQITSRIAASTGTGWLASKPASRTGLTEATTHAGAIAASGSPVTERTSGEGKRSAKCR